MVTLNRWSSSCLPLPSAGKWLYLLEQFTFIPTFGSQEPTVALLLGVVSIRACVARTCLVRGRTEVLSSLLPFLSALAFGTAHRLARLAGP